MDGQLFAPEAISCYIYSIRLQYFNVCYPSFSSLTWGFYMVALHCANSNQASECIKKVSFNWSTPPNSPLCCQDIHGTLLQIRQSQGNPFGWALGFAHLCKYSNRLHQSAPFQYVQPVSTATMPSGDVQSAQVCSKSKVDSDLDWPKSINSCLWSKSFWPHCSGIRGLSWCLEFLGISR